MTILIIFFIRVSCLYCQIFKKYLFLPLLILSLRLLSIILIFIVLGFLCWLLLLVLIVFRVLVQRSSMHAIKTLIKFIILGKLMYIGVMLLTQHHLLIVASIFFIIMFVKKWLDIVIKCEFEIVYNNKWNGETKECLIPEWYLFRWTEWNILKSLI